MVKTENKDHELLQACVQGNTQAFEVLVYRYQSLVCAITYSGTGHFHASEELAQETFLLAWKHLGQLQDFGKFRAWLCRIARNTVQHWLRKSRREVTDKALPLDRATEKESVEFEPTRIMVQREQEEVVNQALSHIPEKYRESLVLFYREEKSTREVAECLGLSENNVRQRITRARTMLRDQVAAMVETTLTRSRPGKAFTGAVMGSIAAGAFKGTSATAALGHAGAQMGWGLSAALTGMAGKLVLLAAGVAIVAGGVSLHRHLTKDTGTPLESAQSVAVGSNQNASTHAQAAGASPAPNRTTALSGGNSSHQVPTQEPSPIPDQSVQGQAMAVKQVQSPAQPPPVLSGKLTDIHMGKPIVNARIRVSPSGGGRVHDVRTDHNGVYAFQSVHANGIYRIRAEHAEYITPDEWERPDETIELHAAKSAVRDFALERGCKVVIKAVNEAGHPVKRVNFHATYVSDDSGRGPKETVRTDPNGSAFIGGLRLDEYWVVGAHPDYALVGQKLKFEGPNEVKSLHFTMEKGIEVTGVATCADDLPASGWEIRAKPIWWHSSRSWPYDDPVTEDGTFLFKHVRAGPHRLQVFIPEDGGSRGIWSTEVNLPPETGFLDFQIPRPSPHGRVNLSGEVVFIGGDYSKGFWIDAASTTEHSGGVYLRADERQFTITDLVPGLYNLNMHINGRRIDFKNVKVPSDNLLLEVPVAVQSVLRARVVDKETGQPVKAFKVWRADQNAWHAIMDPNGYVEIASHGTEARVIVVRAEGYSEIRSEPIVPDGPEPTLIEMELFGALTGRIVNEAGNPIADVTISYRYPHSRYETSDDKLIAETDAQGQFSIHVTSDREYKQWLVFRHPDYARVNRRLLVRGDDVEEIQVVMPAGGTVQGTVYDWQGRPLTDTPIFFMDDNLFSRWKQDLGRLGRVVTDSHGFYRIDHLPTDMCYVFTGNTDRALGMVQSAVLPVNKKTRQFDIGGPWRASGRLLHKGAPVPNTRLIASFDALYVQGFQANTVTNASGEFSFYGLPTGTRTLYCIVQGDKGREVELALGAYAFVAGQDQILGDFKLTLAQVTVDLTFDTPSLSQNDWELSIQTYNDTTFLGKRLGQLLPRMDTDVLYVFANVPAGEFEAVASCKGVGSVRKRFSIAPEQDAHSVTLAVPAGAAQLSGQLLMDGDASRPVSVLLRNAEQTFTQTLTSDEQGYFHAENLPAGRYFIGKTGFTKNRQSVLHEMVLVPGEHKTVDIKAGEGRLGSEGYLTVTLVTGQGIPLAIPDVWLERGDLVIEARVNTDEQKSFAGNPGTYLLCADYPGFKPVRVPVDMLSRRERALQKAYDPVTLVVERE